MRLPIAFWLMILMLWSCKPTSPYFQGYVEGQNLYLASPFSGLLKERRVNRGDRVKKGQLLFRLDPNPQLIALAEIQAQLEQARYMLSDLGKPKRKPEIDTIEAQIAEINSQIKLAQSRVCRYKRLYERNASDEDTLDAAVANLDQLKDRKRQTQANLELAKLGARGDQVKAQKAKVDSLIARLNNTNWELSQKTIFSPDEGIIFDTYYEEGEFVSNQQAVLSLLPPTNIRIEFFVPLGYLEKIHIGQKCYFDCNGCSKNNSAVISYISPEAEFIPPLVYSRDNYEKLVFRIKAKITNAQLLKPGQPVTVTIL